VLLITLLTKVKQTVS